MDDESGAWLFDPATTRQLVLARRPPGRSAVDCVVSDVVWSEVVCLLRWARASTRGTTIETGTWWRLAACCADLLRRLPGLSAEISEPWGIDGPAETPPGMAATARMELVAGRLAGLLRSSGPVPLRTLAGEIDALGESAIHALAERTELTVSTTA